MSALRSWRTLTFPALVALASCGGGDAPLVDADPALWVVRDADTTVYLFGTVHVLKPRLGWFDEAVKDAFDKSDTLVLELVRLPDAEMAALLRDLGTARAAPPLPETLPRDTARKLRKALDELGEPADSLDGAEPWFAAIMLARLPVRELGYDSADNVEAQLSAAADKAGKQVIGLETAREQLGYFDRLPASAQRAMLIELLDHMPTAAARLDATITAWSRGEPDKLADLINDDLDASPELRQALLTDRNRRWAGWIEARMAQPGTVFVAVGAGHLTGRNSLQDELARRDIQVARINY